MYNDGVDAIVRFTVVARSAQAENVSYEGFRCIERERKVYAYGRRDGTWLPAKDCGWIPLGPRVTAGFRTSCSGIISARSVARSRTRGRGSMRSAWAGIRTREPGGTMTD